MPSAMQWKLLRAVANELERKPASPTDPGGKGKFRIVVVFAEKNKICNFAR
jgi:hypothetical protein